jgi:hypothetical protein
LGVVLTRCTVQFLPPICQFVMVRSQCTELKSQTMHLKQNSEVKGILALAAEHAFWSLSEPVLKAIFAARSPTALKASDGMFELLSQLVVLELKCDDLRHSESNVNYENGCRLCYM